ncbi:MAG TPA: hypothetical protein VME40_02735 [Caulobacteraceae bacterium]|nr:hypothetical protein [Caulobacteraceae bacterium]
MRNIHLIAGAAALMLSGTAMAQGPDEAGGWAGTPAAADAAADVVYQGPADDIAARESWLEHRIQRGDSSGALSRGDAEHDFDVLGGIRQFQARQSDRHAGLTGADRADVLNKIDNLTAIVQSQWVE